MTQPTKREREWFDRNCDPDLLRESLEVMETYRTVMREPVNPRLVARKVIESMEPHPPMSFDLSPADVLQLRRFNDAHELQKLRDKAREALTITEAPEHAQAVPEPLRTMVAERKPIPVKTHVSPGFFGAALIGFAFTFGVASVVLAAIWIGRYLCR